MLSKLFKKENKAQSAKIKTLNNTELKSVVGGIDSVDPSTATADNTVTNVQKSKHDAAMAAIQNAR